jgi:hypothetical protein
LRKERGDILGTGKTLSNYSNHLFHTPAPPPRSLLSSGRVSLNADRWFGRSGNARRALPPAHSRRISGGIHGVDLLRDELAVSPDLPALLRRPFPAFHGAELERIVEELLGRGVWMISVCGIDEFHRGLEKVGSGACGRADAPGRTA